MPTKDKTQTKKTAPLTKRGARKARSIQNAVGTASRALASKRGRPSIKNSAANIAASLNDAKKQGKMVRFSYKSSTGIWIKNVTANFMRIEDGVAHFGVIRNSKSTAYPGYRPIKLSNISNIRIVKRGPK